MYDIETNDVVRVSNGEMLHSIVDRLENNKFVVETTKCQTLIVDKDYKIINWVIFIENNLEKEIEYRLWGVRVKNAQYSDGTYGLVNVMTLESVVAKVWNNYINSIEEQDGNKYIVILDNDDEVNVIQSEGVVEKTKNEW